MPEEFAVYRPFRDGATVYCDIFIVFPMRQGVDDFGDGFFSNSAFPRNKHRDIGRGNLNGLFQGAIQVYIVPDDFKSLLDALEVTHLSVVFGIRHGMPKQGG